MKLVIVGRSGQLARSLAERGASQRGLQVVALGRPELDLERPGSAAAAIRQAGADVVINASAYTAVDKAEQEPERAFQVNAEGAGEVAEAARRVAARILHVSTDYVFNGRAGRAYHAEDSADPLNVYGRSKLQGEERVRAAAPDHLIVRTSWVYGPFGGGFVSTMLQLAAKQASVRVVDDQYGTPTSVIDLADGLLAVATSWDRGSDAGLGRTMHLAGADVASWAELARGIFAEAARLGLPTARVAPIPNADYPVLAKRPLHSALDSTDFKAAFEFEAPGWQRALPPVLAGIAARRHLDREGTSR